MRFPRPSENWRTWADQLISRLDADFYSRPVIKEVTLGGGAQTEIFDGAVRGHQSFVIVHPNDAATAGATPFVQRANTFEGRFLIDHNGGAGGSVRYAVL